MTSEELNDILAKIEFYGNEHQQKLSLEEVNRAVNEIILKLSDESAEAVRKAREEAFEEGMKDSDQFHRWWAYGATGLVLAHLVYYAVA